MSEPNKPSPGPDAKTETPEQKGKILRCSFCNKSQRDVKKLIAGPENAVLICDECVDICLDIIAEDRKDETAQTLIPADLLAAADAVVPGHMEMKKAIAAILTAHAKQKGERLSSMMIGGPTGAGKSQLIEAMASAASVPIAIAEVPLLFPDAPFKAKLQLGEFDSKPGVIVLNQIDSIAMRGEKKDECRRMQQVLVSIIDGAWIQLGEETRKKSAFNTANALFIGLGSFSDLPRDIPFTPELLAAHGFLPELVARFGAFFRLKPLSEQELAELLTRPRGFVSQCMERFGRQGLKISFDDGAIKEIARLGAKRKAGIRGLKAMTDRLGIALACEKIAEGAEEFVVDAAYVTRHLS